MTAHALGDQLHRTAADLSNVVDEPAKPWLFSRSSHTSEAFRRAYLRSLSLSKGCSTSWQIAVSRSG